MKLFDPKNDVHNISKVICHILFSVSTWYLVNRIIKKLKTKINFNDIQINIITLLVTIFVLVYLNKLNKIAKNDNRVTKQIIITFITVLFWIIAWKSMKKCIDEFKNKFNIDDLIFDILLFLTSLLLLYKIGYLDHVI